MMKTAITSLGVLVLCAAIALAGGQRKRTWPTAAEPNERVAVEKAPLKPTPMFDYSAMNSAIGTPTTLGGFYDYQSNGGSIQHIRVNPANGNIHVTYMSDPDSAVPNTPNRGSYYAFSTNGGVSWNNFSNLRVPNRRSGFPTLELGRGTVAGGAIIANHSAIGTATLGTIFVDFPEGSGAFAEIQPPTGGIGGSPIWPFIGSANDGSVVMACSPNVTGGQTQYARTTDFTGWTPYTAFPGTSATGGRYPVHGNGTGRIGIMVCDAGTPGIYFLESTNNGANWPASATVIHPTQRIVPPDTFQNFVGGDFTYNGDTPLFVMEELNAGANAPTDSAQITFYSQATGFKVVASPLNTPNVPGALNKRWVNYPRLGTPAITMSGSRIVIVYNAVQRETSAAGFNYSDIFLVISSNGGNTWSVPYNVTRTSNLEERYPSLSPWNPDGFVHMTFQEDYQPGPAAFNGNFQAAPFSRAHQRYLKNIIVGVEDIEPRAVSFKLSQNYPNPFNPATKIDYTVAQAGPVSIKVYNTLGQQVATLLNENLSPGQYQVTFDGGNLPSGVYYYTLKAGSFTSTKKMVLMK